MKKIIILVIMLFCNFVNAQEEFTEAYSSYIVKNQDESQSEWVDLDIVVSFHNENTQNVVMFFPTKTLTFRIVGEVTTGETESKEFYQLFYCFEPTTESKVLMQLFAEALRLIFTDGSYYEYHK